MDGHFSFGQSIISIPASILREGGVQHSGVFISYVSTDLDILGYMAQYGGHPCLLNSLSFYQWKPLHSNNLFSMHVFHRISYIFVLEADIYNF